VDTAVDTNPDRTGAKAQAIALAGVIYTIRPGLDIDVGFRERLTPVGPAHQWLLGITYRGSL
jgi:hypothetical protein